MDKGITPDDLADVLGIMLTEVFAAMRFEELEPHERLDLVANGLMDASANMVDGAPRSAIHSLARSLLKAAG